MQGTDLVERRNRRRERGIRPFLTREQVGLGRQPKRLFQNVIALEVSAADGGLMKVSDRRVIPALFVGDSAQREQRDACQRMIVSFRGEDRLLQLADRLRRSIGGGISQ